MWNHGTASAYGNWDCRCELCKVAGSIKNARDRIKAKRVTGKPLSPWEQEVADDDDEAMANGKAL